MLLKPPKTEYADVLTEKTANPSLPSAVSSSWLTLQAFFRHGPIFLFVCLITIPEDYLYNHTLHK